MTEVTEMGLTAQVDRRPRLAAVGGSLFSGRCQQSLLFSNSRRAVVGVDE